MLDVLGLPEQGGLVGSLFSRYFRKNRHKWTRLVLGQEHTGERGFSWREGEFFDGINGTNEPWTKAPTNEDWFLDFCMERGTIFEVLRELRDDDSVAQIDLNRVLWLLSDPEAGFIVVRSQVRDAVGFVVANQQFLQRAESVPSTG